MLNLEPESHAYGRVVDFRTSWCCRQVLSPNGILVSNRTARRSKERMGLVDSWLEGIGLGYAVPIFAGQGINSPDMLSALDVVDFPELGISDQNDRKKVNRSWPVS